MLASTTRQGEATNAASRTLEQGQREEKKTHANTQTHTLEWRTQRSRQSTKINEKGEQQGEAGLRCGQQGARTVETEKRVKQEGDKWSRRTTRHSGEKANGTYEDVRGDLREARSGAEWAATSGRSTRGQCGEEDGMVESMRRQERRQSAVRKGYTRHSENAFHRRGTRRGGKGREGGKRRRGARHGRCLERVRHFGVRRWPNAHTRTESHARTRHRLKGWAAD